MSDVPNPSNVDGPAPVDDTAKVNRNWVWWVLGGVVLIAVLAFVYSANSTVEVPRTIGMTQQAATAVLAEAGLRSGKVSEVATLAAEPGIVVAQSPRAGEDVRKETAVDLSVAAVPVVTVPDLVGDSISEANEKLAVEGLRAGEVQHVYDDKVEAGQVTAQDPDAGSEAQVADFVNLTVSKGREQGEVPNVIGLSASDAEATMEAAGFDVKTVKAASDSVPAGDVIDQSPAAGVVADAGSLVTLTVSTGAPEAPAASGDSQESSTPDTNDQAAQPDEDADGAKPDAGAPGDEQTPEKPSTPEVQTVAVPDLVGARILDAISQLKTAKLKVDFAFVSSSEYLLRVAAQDPAAETDVEIGSVVTVSIGLPPFLFGEAPPPTAKPLPAPAPGGASEETTTAPK